MNRCAEIVMRIIPQVLLCVGVVCALGVTVL